MSIYEAAARGDLSGIAASGAPIEARDHWGRTALHLALQTGDLAKVTLLHTAGATLAAGDQDGRSPLSSGTRADRADQFGSRPIGRATRPEIVQLLLAAGGDLNAVSDEMRQALFGLPVDATMRASREE